MEEKYHYSTGMYDLSYLCVRFVRSGKIAIAGCQVEWCRYIRVRLSKVSAWMAELI